MAESDQRQGHAAGALGEPGQRQQTRGRPPGAAQGELKVDPARRCLSKGRTSSHYVDSRSVTPLAPVRLFPSPPPCGGAMKVEPREENTNI